MFSRLNDLEEIHWQYYQMQVASQMVQMQQIAREFNFSESTFVFPPEKGNTRKIRIFTPSTEVPFAGHPNIGTAFVLASLQA